MLIHLLSRINKYKKPYRFFLYNILSVFIFGFLYWLNDLMVDFIINNYPEYSNKYINCQECTGKISSLIYYIWFSFITQTTVGYTGLVNAEGKSMPFLKFPYWTFKILNIMQLFSIFFIPVMLI